MVIFLIVIILIPINWLLIRLKFSKKMNSMEETPIRKVAIVFGAGLQKDGTPSPVLKDRIEAAVSLLKTNKVEKILFSGDNRYVNYNEPESMRSYALTLGVPDSSIVLDYAGRRTYDTCYRAKYIFGITNAVLVTQRFHLPRALFICTQLDMNVSGTIADNRIYSNKSMQYWNLREMLATTAAIWDVFIKKPLPVLGEKEPIA